MPHERATPDNREIRVNSKTRLTHALTGKSVDRTPVNFYEVGGFAVDPDAPDPFNIYNDPSWRPLLELAENETDLIRMVAPDARPAADNCRDALFSEKTEERDGARYTYRKVRVGGRTLTETQRRDAGVNTVWQVEHLLKGPDDARAFLELPDEVFAYEPDAASIMQAEEALGDRGLVMVDTGDPLCAAAALFSMEDYIAMAYTESALFHRLLEKFARHLYPFVEKTAAAAPGRLWRVYGPEYASEPYLPPPLFRDYVHEYTTPIIKLIHKHGGMARLHSHGRLRNILPIIAEMGADALDPVEPPPQGDITLREVRNLYGADMTLFGNIEVSTIETLESDAFEGLVKNTLREVAETSGKGFVLMPTAAPYGRRITANTLRNYETLVRLAKLTP